MAQRSSLKATDLKKAYLLIGEDALLKKKQLDRIVSACLAGASPDFDYADLDGRQLDLDTLCDELIRYPLMAEKRCVVVTNLRFPSLSPTDKKRLCDAVKSLSDTVCFVIYQSGIAVDRRRPEGFLPLIKAIESAGEVMDFEHETPAQLRTALSEFCRRRGVRLDSSVAEYMTQVCSRDLGILKNEADKLCYVCKERGIIQKADIDLVCSRMPSARIFDLADAVIGCRAADAMKIIDGLLFEGLVPAQLCSAVCGTFIDIYRQGAAMEADESVADSAKRFGCPARRAFLLERARKLAKMMTPSARRESLDILQSTDQKLKSSGQDGRAAIEECALRLITVIKGAKA